MIVIKEEYIRVAIENPVMFYYNILENIDCETAEHNERDAEIILLDGCPFISVYYFLSNIDIAPNYINDFKEFYSDNLKSECANISREDSEIQQIVKSNVYLRNLIFKKEYEYLLQCDNCSSFENYLNAYGGICEEFDLYAKYKIAIEKRIDFPYFQKIISSYCKSDLFDIDALKQRCQDIYGFHVFWSDNVLPSQKEVITQLLKDMKYLSGNNLYILKTPISKKQWSIVTNSLSSDILKIVMHNIDSPMICTKEECIHFLNSFQSLTGISARLLNLQEIQHCFTKENDPNSCCMFEWYAEEDTNSPQITIHSQSSFGINSVVNNLVYATFRVII